MNITREVPANASPQPNGTRRIIDAATTAFSVSLLTVSKGDASKKFVADAHGQPMRDPEQTLAIAAGRVEHVQLAGLAGLAELLQRVTPKQALVHGVPQGSQPGATYKLLTAAQYQGAADTIARTLECFTYPADVSLLMIDRDPDPADPQMIMTATDLMQRLATIFPPFAEAGWLATVSTSSALRDKATREWVRPPEGFHIYCLVTGDIARFRELARVRLWLAGTGFCKLASPNAHTGVSAILERCLIDAQTPPRHPCYQWSVKPTGCCRLNLPLGRPHFSTYNLLMYYIS